MIIALYFLSLLSPRKNSNYLNISDKSVKRENKKIPDYVLGILLEQGNKKKNVYLILVLTEFVYLS